MKKKLLLGACALAVIGLSACSTQRFEINPNPIETTEPSYSETQHFIFWGINQVETLYPGEACGPEGVNRVETSKTFMNGFLTYLTWGIYSPRTYAVYCNSQKRMR